MILDDLRDFIISNSADWDESNTFASSLPEDPDDALVVYEYTGGGVDYVLGGGSHVIETAQIQVVVRSPAYATARSRSNVIQALLTTIGSTTMNGVRYLRVLAEDMPHDIGNDPKQRVRIATNYRATKEPTP